MNYTTHGVCSRAISFEVKDNKVTDVHFVGGCSGNTQGVAALVEGMDIDEAIKRLKGIKCGPRPTSCPDQLATALEQYKAQQQEQPAGCRFWSTAFLSGTGNTQADRKNKRSQKIKQKTDLLLQQV